MRRRRGLALVLLAVVLLVAMPTALTAQEPESVLVAHGADVSAYPKIAVTVTLPVALLLAGEGEADFSLFENGEPREVTSVEPLAAVRTPVDTVLLVDTSGSMWGTPMEDTKRAAAAFIAAMGPDDQIAVVSFDSEVRILAEFTSDRAALGEAIDRLEATGRTALYDGVVKSTELLFGREQGDRVIVLLSDGGDNASVNALDQAVTQLRASGASMYAIGLETPETDMGVLATMAAQSRGRLVGVSDSSDLVRLYEDIARELTTQYRITFESAEPNTKDLDLRVVATMGESRGAAAFAISNPYFTSLEAEETGTGTEPASPATSWALAALVVALAFASGTMAAGAVFSMFGRRSRALDDLTFYDQLRGVEDTTTTRAAGVTGVLREAVGAVAGRRGFTPLVHDKLDRAGLPLRPVEYMYMHIAGVVATGVIVQLLTRSFPVALLATIVAVLLPILLLENAIARRKQAFEAQLPEILSMMASSLRAGWGVQQSIDLVVQEMSDPAAGEFRRVQAQSRLGLSVEDALEKMAERLDSDDFRWTVTAIAIQREMGGNLAEVLDVVAGTMRERAELRRHIHALTSEGRLSAVILFALPFIMLAVLLLVNPGYIAPMFTSVFGLILLVGGAVLLVVGGLWLRRAADVEV